MHLFRSTFASLLLLANSGSVVASPAGPTSTACAANNCLRAVRATNFPNRPSSQDCSNYFASTPSPIPTYATTCQPAAYSSACSCIGVTAPSAKPTFAIEATYASGANAGTSAGYARLEYDGGFNNNYVYTGLQATPAGAAVFRLASGSTPSDLTVNAGDYAGRPIQAYNINGGYMGVLLNARAQTSFMAVQCQQAADYSLSCTHSGEAAVFGLCSDETGRPDFVVGSASSFRTLCSTQANTVMLTLKAVTV